MSRAARRRTGSGRGSYASPVECNELMTKQPVGDERAIPSDRGPARLGLQTALLLALAVLAATVPATAGQPLLIVAAGDSFASGEGAPDQPGLVIQPPRWRADYF